MSEQKQPQNKKLDVASLTPQERERLRDDLKREEQKGNWRGKHGVWSSFRRVGTEYATKPSKEVNDNDKKARLKQQLEAFIRERLS